MKPMKLDADVAGELIVICKRIKTAWGEDPHLFFDGFTVKEIGCQYYKLGRIVQRLMDNVARTDDIERINTWKDALL